MAAADRCSRHCRIRLENPPAPGRAARIVNRVVDLPPATRAGRTRPDPTTHRGDISAQAPPAADSARNRVEAPPEGRPWREVIHGLGEADRKGSRHYRR